MSQLRRGAAALIEEIAETRRAGVAYDLDAHTEVISAVGATFETANGAIFAVSVPDPTSRFVEKRDTLTGRLAHTVSRIRALLPG